jgi:AcrR family transcriptional regulator
VTLKPARGRPADPAIDEQLRRATLEVLAEDGWRGVTIDRIAARAGIARSTIYRRHGSLHGLLLMLMGDIYTQVPVPDTGDVRSDLVALMRDVADVWHDPRHVHYLSALVAAQHEDRHLADAYRAQFRHRRSQTTTIIDRAITRGQLPADTDAELLLDFLAGIVAQRILLAREPLSPEFPETVVTHLLHGFATPN